MDPIIYFDLETGGLELSHPIIQIAAVAVVQGQIVDEFEAKIKFDIADYAPEALEKNSYNEADWLNAVEPMQAALAFSRFLDPYKCIKKISARTGRPYYVAKLAGYNAAVFDAPRLQELFKRLGVFLPADYKVLDVFQLALWYFENQSKTPENLQLGTVLEFFGHPLENAHDAMADVQGTAMLAQILSSELFKAEVAAHV